MTGEFHRAPAGAGAKAEPSADAARPRGARLRPCGLTGGAGLPSTCRHPALTGLPAPAEVPCEFPSNRRVHVTRKKVSEKLVSRDAQNPNPSPVGSGLLSPPRLPPSHGGLLWGWGEAGAEGTPGQRNGTGESENQVSGSGFEMREARSRRSWWSARTGDGPSRRHSPPTAACTAQQ